MRHAEGWPEGARHCLRIGAMSDKQVIEDAQDSFDVLVVQGNLAISAPQGLGSWLALDKPFWIDPITYAFAANPKYLRPRDKPNTYKRTFVSLAEAYGEPFGLPLARNSKLTPADFPADLIPEAADRVLRFQLEVLQPPESDSKYGIGTQLEPALATIPFFPLQYQGTEPPWLRVNLEFISAAAEQFTPSRLAAAMLVEQDLIDDWDRFEPYFNEYLDRLDAVEIRDLWLWISENDETRMTVPRARRVLTMISELGERGIRVHQAFAGSFSSFALSRGLTSIGHGVNYWENKGWEPLASGGLPVARYFYPPLRERLRVPEAIAAVDTEIGSPQAFHEQVCGCATCTGVVAESIADFGQFGEVTIRKRRTRGGGTAEFDSPTPKALYLTKTHYLRARGIEVARALEPGFNPAALLRADAAQNASDVTRTSHLENWAKAFEEGPIQPSDG